MSSVPPPPISTPPPRIRLATFEDHASIESLEQAHDFIIQPAEDWQRLWLENPLWPKLKDNWPIGWVLENPAGKIVGSLLNIPSRYTFHGRDLLCANGRSWVVATEYRGFALWLMAEYFGQSGIDLFINTTVGPMATQTFSTLSARVPVGDWQTVAYFITNYRGFAERTLQKLHVPIPNLAAFPASVALRLKDALLAKSPPAVSGDVRIDFAEQFDSRFDLFWENLARQNANKLLSVRDSHALTWHFAIPLRHKRLWILTAWRGEQMIAYVILKRQDQIQQAIPRTRLVDFQTLEPQTDLLGGLLHEALRRCRAEKLCMLEHLGCDIPKMAAFDRYAPYRHKLDAWKFYYHAADPAINAELAASAVWDPSVFDGDASFE